MPLPQPLLLVRYLMRKLFLDLLHLTSYNMIIMTFIVLL
jgi:hypothetical protein